MAQTTHHISSLCFPPKKNHHHDTSPFLSSLPKISSHHLKPISLSLRSTSLLKPILCSISTTLVNEIENPSSKTQQEEISTTRLLAQNVPWKSTADDIRALFQKHGTVVNVELSMHDKTRNRGLAFVEMGSSEEAALAISNLEKFDFEGRTLKLNYAKPKKTTSPVVQPKPPVLYNLFVANLSFETRTKDLKDFFQTDGVNAVSAEVVFLDNPRRPSGYGFVAFKTKKEADEALSTFQGKEMMGRPVRVARSKRFVKLEAETKNQSEDPDSEQPEAIDNL